MGQLNCKLKCQNQNWCPFAVFEVEEIYPWLNIKHHKNQMNCHYVYLNLSFNSAFVGIRKKCHRSQPFTHMETDIPE